MIFLLPCVTRTLFELIDLDFFLAHTTTSHTVNLTGFVLARIYRSADDQSGFLRCMHIYNNLCANQSIFVLSCNICLLHPCPNEFLLLCATKRNFLSQWSSFLFATHKNSIYCWSYCLFVGTKKNFLCVDRSDFLLARTKTSYIVDLTAFLLVRAE